MKTQAVVLDAYGGPEQLRRIEEVELPQPGVDEAVIRVSACGANFHDIDLLRGQSRRGISLPLILGREVAGSVEVAASDGSGPQIGEQVAVAYSIPCGHYDPCV